MLVYHIKTRRFLNEISINKTWRKPMESRK